MVQGYVSGLRLGKADKTAEEELAYERERRGITDKRGDDAFNVLAKQYGAIAGDPQTAAALAGEARATQNQGWKAEDRGIEAEDRAKTKADAAQLRGLLMLKTARDKDMSPGDAINAMGPGGLRAFGTDFDGMMTFAQQVAENPAILDARIAGLTGKSSNVDGKRIFKQDFVVGPDGKRGVLFTFQDGTTQFSTDYQNVPQQGTAAVKFDAAGNTVDPYTGAIIAQAPLGGIVSRSAADTFGTGLGKSQADAVTSLPAASQAVQKSLAGIDAVLMDANLDAILGSPSFSGMLQKGGLGGLTQLLGDFGVAPGSPAAEAAAKLEFVASQQFLQGIQALKGFGPVTEREGLAAQQAQANLSRLRDPKAIKAELQRLASHLKAYYAALEQEAAGGFTGLQAPGPAAPRGGAAPDPQATGGSGTPKVSSKYY